ncbi:hypothetical protein ABG067_005421 [Albugo candida]|uniref:Protein kinase domain-containing protein n=1 Tax=Albugo candida TaxID=65357 RepID=A0A024FU51_9STRA|nr:unnamed protein product [Albugo candida]|eukprot:CCI10447.1 unnamed protein product [Albugo candida]
MSSLQSRTKVHSRINPSNEALVGATSKYELTSKKAVIPLHNKKNVRLQLDMTEPRPQDIPCHWQEDPIIAKLDDYNSAQRKSDFYVSCATTVAQVVDLVATTGIRDKEITHTVPRKVNLTCERRLGQDTHFEDGVIFDGPAEIGNDTKRISDLGRGAGGFVSLALYLPLLKLVAVKEITIRNAQEREMVKNELHALHLNLSHMDAITFKSRVQKYMHFGRELGTYRSEEDKSPFLVSFYGAYLTPSRSSISIVMDYMDMGSVQNMLDGPNGFTLSEDLVRHVAFCCVHALHSMHSKS